MDLGEGKWKTVVAGLIDDPHEESPCLEIPGMLHLPLV